MEHAMLKKIPVFALAFVSGSALAGPVATLLGGLTGSAPAPVALPGLGSLPTQQIGSITGGLANTLTSTRPLPGLGGGNSTEEPSGDLLSVGVLNQDEPLIGGCIVGECMSTSDIPVLGQPLNTVGSQLSSGLRGVLVPFGEDLGFVGETLDPVTSIPSSGIDLFGGPNNENDVPDDTLNAGVLAGNDSGSGGTIGVAALSTASENGDTAQADSLAVGVLNGRAAGPTPPPPGPGPIGGNPEIETGGSTVGENKTADAGDRNALCSVLTKDSRGKVIAKTKVRCGALRSPNA